MTWEDRINWASNQVLAQAIPIEMCHHGNDGQVLSWIESHKIEALEYINEENLWDIIEGIALNLSELLP
ncbi:MAG: hypothetical protein ACPH5P_00290 [Akkermansiaceae bacterium]